MDKTSLSQADNEMFKSAMTNRSAPSCTVIPVLIYDDVGKAAEWLYRTFGFTERLRAGNDHAQIAIGDGAIILSRSRKGQGFASPDEADFREPRPNEVTQYVHVNVKDVDRHYELARKRGAKILQPPANHPFGERQYTAEDFAGHRWTFSQTIADVDPAEWGAKTPDVNELQS